MGAPPAGLAPSAAAAGDRRFFGHPRGLATLFFTELWERWSFYGMRALLVPFMAAAPEKAGLGYAEGDAVSVYHIYLALVYLLSLPGGWVADRILGARRSVLAGGIVIMAGHVCLAIHGVAPFFAGLGLVVLGTGLLKPNVSTIVGFLYAPKDARRDAGFSIFYMGINLGAFLAPLVTGWVQPEVEVGKASALEAEGVGTRLCWQLSFGSAAVGMLLGLIQFVRGSRHLGEAGKRPAVEPIPATLRTNRRILWSGLGAVLGAGAILAALAKAGTITVTLQGVDDAFGLVLVAITLGFFAWLFLAGRWSSEERRRLFVISVLFVGSTLFWSGFEQAGSTLNLFAQNKTSLSFAGIPLRAGWFQSLEPIFLIALAPVFAWIWLRLGPRDPPSPTKFSLGLLFAGLSFAALFVAEPGTAGGARVSPLWLTATYFCHAVGELCLSPVGLSAMTKLAPPRVASLMMGAWFLSLSDGIYLGGRIAHACAGLSDRTLFGTIAAISFGGALLLALFVRPIRRLLREPR